MELILITLRKSNPNRHNRSVASSSSETGLSDDAQLNSLSVGNIEEAHFGNGFLLDLVLNARWPTKVSTSRIAIMHSSMSAFQLAATIPARHRANVILSVDDVEKILRIGLYLAAFDSVWSILPKLSSSVAAKKSIA